MTEANWFGSPDTVLAPTVKRIDRTPAETKQIRCFDQVTRTKDKDLPISLPLTYLRPYRERRVRRLMIWLGELR